MGLAETQKVLARLYTDAVLRERFFADPLKVGEEFGLGREDAQQLASLSASEVNFFADSLRAKRLQEVRDLLPLTTRALGQRTAPLFREYAETNLPEGIKKHRADAAAFADYLAGCGALRGSDTEWVAELARYEKAWLKAWDMTRGIIACRFPLAIDDVAREVSRGNVRPTPKRKATFALWFRLTPARRLRHLVL